MVGYNFVKEVCKMREDIYVDEIENLKTQIATLPQGYISTKTIYGKKRYYLQWKQGKQVKSKYIKLGELEYYENAIALRKQLQTELQKRLATYVEGMRNLVSTDFATNVIVGEELLKLANMVQGYGKRDCYAELQNFLKQKPDGRVCLLYGLRRTGKTTMLFQTLEDMSSEELRHTAYIKVLGSDTLAILNQDMKKLNSLGYKYVFIDEVTLMQEFIDSASLFSDVYAMQGMKIVLSGTDSLGFWIANCNELYDRARMIHTTFISFREYSRLLGIDDIDDYIRYGGTLRAGELNFDDEEVYAYDASFRDDETTRRYIDTAICSNIQHSLVCYQKGGHFRNLRSLYQAGELTNAVNRIIEDVNHDFLVDVVTRMFRSHDLGSAADLLRKARDQERRTDALDFIDVEAVTERFMKLLDMKNEQEVRIDDAHVQEIKEYLEALELVIDCSQESTMEVSTPSVRTIFTQPGMRFCQAQALVHSIIKDEFFHSLSQKEKDLIVETILNDVRGRMLEDIVLLETSLAVGEKKQVFKMSFAAGEYDMVIYDSISDTHEAYEIKHSERIVENQYRHLINQENIQKAEHRFGKMTKRCVLYKGENAILKNGIEYQNVEEYLKGLEIPLQKWATRK